MQDANGWSVLNPKLLLGIVFTRGFNMLSPYKFLVV